MASESPLEDAIEKAKLVGFGRPEVLLMRVVIAWMNNYRFEIGGRTLQVDRHHEPSLQELVEAVGLTWTDDLEAAHDRLQDKGVFKTRRNGDTPYCAGSYCRWLPSEDFLEIARTVFDEDEDIYPSWHRGYRNAAPIFGDGHELLPHRKGVLAARQTLRQLSWVNAWTLYPEQGGVKPDLVTGRDKVHGENARVESLTGNGDRDRWVAKWQAWASTDLPTIWVFDNRDAMVAFFNELHGHEDLTGTDAALHLHNGTFDGDPNNWSAKAVNERLKRSRERNGYYNPTHDLVCTLPSLLEADGDTVEEWCQTYEVFLENRGGEYWVVNPNAKNQ